MSTARLIAAALVLAALAAPALAADPPAPGAVIEGPAVALDGGTVIIDGQRIRLFGIDTPEMRDTVGRFARAALDDLIDGRDLACTVVDTDRYKRPVARCSAGLVADLGRAMVATGWAVGYRTFTTEYDDTERAARAAGAGLWADAPGGAVGPDRPAWLDHWFIRGLVAFYRELVVWQTGLGAIIGLWGLAWVVRWNFKKTRDRDKDLRDEEARAVTTVIYGEMISVRRACAAIRVWIDGLGTHPVQIDDMTYETVTFPIVNVYEKLVSKLGILPPELVDRVVSLYGKLINTQQALEIFMRRGDVSKVWLALLDQRLASLSDEIEPVAVELAAFADFEMADDFFRSIDEAAKSARADSFTAAMAVIDPPNESD